MVQQNKIKERHGALMKKMAASPRRAQLEVELKAKRAELDRMTTEYQSKVNVRKKRHSLFSSFFFSSLSLSPNPKPYFLLLLQLLSASFAVLLL